MTQLPSGVYRPGDSIMHGLDAVMKFICFILLLVAVLATDTPAGYTGIGLFVLAVAYLAGMDTKRVLASLKKFWWLLLLVVLSNFAFYAPGETFGAWWVFTPSYSGLYKGICIAARIAMIIVLTNALTCTTAPLKLTSAVETILAPLSRLKIPVERFMVMSRLSARLLPSLFEDAEFIRINQKARGVDFAAKGFLNKAETAQPLIMPLLLTSFRRADRLSMTLEARGFKAGSNPFPVRKAEPAAADWTALLVCAAVCAMQIIIL